MSRSSLQSYLRLIADGLRDTEDSFAIKREAASELDTSTYNTDWKMKLYNLYSSELKNKPQIKVYYDVENRKVIDFEYI